MVGCGQKRSEPVAKLEGSVTIGGKPLPADAEGSLIFMPAARGEAPPGRPRSPQAITGPIKCPSECSLSLSSPGRAGPSRRRVTDLHPTVERIDLVPKRFRSGVPIKSRATICTRTSI